MYRNMNGGILTDNREVTERCKQLSDEHLDGTQAESYGGGESNFDGAANEKEVPTPVISEVKEAIRQLKNKKSAGKHSIGLLTLIPSGIFLAVGLFNPELHQHSWTFDHEEYTILLTILVFHLGAIAGAAITAYLLATYYKQHIARFYYYAYIGAGVLLAARFFDLWSIFIARILGGMAFGSAYLSTVIHAGEIASDELRSTIVGFVNGSLMVGYLLHATINSLILYDDSMEPTQIYGIIAILAAVSSGVCATFLTRESPLFLLNREGEMAAADTIAKLRQEPIDSPVVFAELVEAKIVVLDDPEHHASLHKEGNLRPLSLLIICAIIKALSFNLIINLLQLYAIDEINAWWNIQDYNLAPVLMILIRLVVAFAGIQTVDRLPRKLLFTVPSFVSGVLLLVAGIFYQTNRSELSSATVVPLFLVYQLVSASGCSSTGDVYCSEAFPPKKKVLSVALVQSVEQLVHVVVLSIAFSPKFSINEPIFGSILLAAGVPILVGSIVLQVLLPETKDVSLRQARVLFEKGR
ncbi:uncharacterized protein LOC128735220 [Sabethes cyaneus]|uniref:uncharacterized protein LOC128735220 n=1 Tax=Sabethes cyaneus TaxID=53552 RepID=UPI00237E38ED|nr:uncharacterized protein LOC128735220 [Sabethes cyaneus]